MAQNKEALDKKLVEELKQKLDWFTYEATEEEFDSQQVQAIVALLDRLDPPEEVKIKTDGGFVTEADGEDALREEGLVSMRDPEAALRRFQKKYGITEEDLAKKNGKIRPHPNAADASTLSEECAEELFPVGDKNADNDKKDPAGASDGEKEREKRRTKTRKPGRKATFLVSVGGKVAAAVIIAVGAVTFFGLGTSAVTKKSFFEVMQDGVNSLKVTVTGETPEEEVGEIVYGDDSKIYYDSWDEVKEEAPDILTPTYIPEDMELSELYREDEFLFTFYKALYTSYDGKENLTIVIDYFEKKYSQSEMTQFEGWNLIESVDGFNLYQKNNEYEIIFWNEKSKYTIKENDEEKLKMIAQNMK